MTCSKPDFPFSSAILNNKDKPMEVRIAMAMVAAAESMPIDFPENCMLPTISPFSSEDFAGYVFGGGIVLDDKAYQRLTEEYPCAKKEIDVVRDKMSAYSTYKNFERHNTSADLRLAETMVCWGGSWGGHANISFGKLATIGTNGIRSEIEECRLKNPGKDDFYNACILATSALDIIGGRVHALASQRALENTPFKKEWARIADTFTRVPKEPAKDFYQAVMVYWMLYTMDGVDSPGRFDQEMISFYRCSIAQDQNDMVHRFLEAMHNVRGWNLCLSGSDENGNDETNELSYAILQAVTDMHYQTPNLTVRVHPGTPEKLWRMSAACIATGIGLPALYNDSVVCKALEKLGIPPCDSHDYCMNGCNQIDIMGKSHMGLEDGEVNLAKVLELTLFGGYDQITGGDELISLPTGSPAALPDFNAFLSLYYRHLDYITDRAIAMSNNAQQMYALYAPNPLRSLFLEGCLEKGRDYKNGGPLYGHGQILMEGIADTVDSLYAIKKLVYEDKAYSMQMLIDALNADFAGYDNLYHDFKSCDKFGNDIPGVDSIATLITDHFFAYLKTKPTFRGGFFAGGCSPFSRAASNGEATAALPNGKHKGESTFADSVAATPGNDVHGPTASLKSMMCYHQDEVCSGFVSQMKFDKALFQSKAGEDAFLRLAKTYFANGGQQLSINVLDKETLLDAQIHPEKHGDLIVRVGGYSEYFTKLSSDLQQNVIDRATFSL